MCVSLMLVVGLSVIASTQGLDLQCDAVQPSPLRVSVRSRLNNTGYWISKVELRQRAGSDPSGSTVDVEHSTVQCAKSEESALNIALTFTAPPQTDKVPTVPKGYELLPGVGLYKFHTDPANWTSARQVCAEEGAHLVVFNSEKESEAINNLFARYPTITGATNNDFAWVGVFRTGEEYYTVLGDTLRSTGFERWHPGQPHRGNEYCILMYRGSGGLADITCDWKQPFICEYKQN